MTMNFLVDKWGKWSRKNWKDSGRLENDTTWQCMSPACLLSFGTPIWPPFGSSALWYLSMSQGWASLEVTPCLSFSKPPLEKTFSLSAKLLFFHLFSLEDFLEVKVTHSCLTRCDPMNSLGQNTGVGSLSLLQGIFPTQRLNPGLPRSRWILYQLSPKGDGDNFQEESGILFSPLTLYSLSVASYRFSSSAMLDTVWTTLDWVINPGVWPVTGFEVWNWNHLMKWKWH